MPSLEVAAETTFGTWLAAQTDGAWLYFKWEPGNGWPDRWLIGPGGRIIFGEWKAANKRLEKLQAERKIQLERRGHVVYVWNDLQKAKQDFRDYLHAEGLPERGY